MNNLGGRSVMSSPAITTRPEVGGKTPAMTLKVSIFRPCSTDQPGRIESSMVRAEAVHGGKASE